MLAKCIAATSSEDDDFAVSKMRTFRAGTGRVAIAKDKQTGYYKRACVADRRAIVKANGFSNMIEGIIEGTEEDKAGKTIDETWAAE